MADDSRPFPMLSPEALKRLQKNERAQASKTKADGLPVEYVSVEALWMLQRGRCRCIDCDTGEPAQMDAEAKTGAPDGVVIMHIFPRGAKGGHTISNVRLGRADHNLASAHQEWRDIAKGRRMSVNWTKKDEPELVETRPSRSPSKWRAKPDGYVSKLSKKHRDQVKARMERT